MGGASDGERVCLIQENHVFAGMVVPMNGPPFAGDPSALVIIDWSWWLNKAFRIGGVDGMASLVVGWLTGLLGQRPAHIAIALDSAGETFRHRMTHPSDPEWRYKGGREPKPDDFYALSERLTEIARLHRIPAYWVEGLEADDCLATAALRGAAAGLRVFMLTPDKDLEALVADDPDGGAAVRRWTPATGREPEQLIGPREVFVRWGVAPAQLPDLLAIASDTVDAIPGVRGLGVKKAAAIIRAFGGLFGALAPPPWSEEQIAKERAAVDEITDVLERKLALSRVAVEKARATLVADGHLALFSRELVRLVEDAPIDWRPEELPIGGFDAERLRKVYTDLGFSRLARDVAHYPKRPPFGNHGRLADLECA